jgi:hypothetical protein
MLPDMPKPKTPRAHTRRVAPGAYTARSHSHPGRHHHVGVSSHGVATCSCESYTLGEGRPCWAMKAVARRLLRHRSEREETAAR